MENINKTYISASKATLERLPKYLSYLKEKKKDGTKNISSTIIADKLRLNPVQVRKDLALASSVAGKPKTGFDIFTLIKDIEKFLGYDNVNEAILVGVGGLGKALLSYDGFENYGLNIIAAFDNDKKLYNTIIKGKKIFPMDKLKELVKRMNIHMGIITVNKENAQEICDLMIEAGIKAIWNYAPVHLHLPDGIAIKNEDMASSLAILSKRLTKILENE